MAAAAAGQPTAAAQEALVGRLARLTTAYMGCRAPYNPAALAVELAEVRVGGGEARGWAWPRVQSAEWLTEGEVGVTWAGWEGGVGLQGGGWVVSA